MSRPISGSPSGGSPARPARQARAVATRERILEAAAADFAAVGYHGSSLSRILERDPSVTKGALYFHFASKEAMALAVVEATSELYRDVVARAAVDDADLDPLRRAARLASGVQDLLHASTVGRAGVRLAGEGAVGPTWSSWPTRFWEATFAALFAEAHARGDIRGEVDPAAMGRFVTDISHGAFTTSMVTTGLADLAGRVTHNWDVMFGFMADPRWLAEWRSEGGMAAVMRRHLALDDGGGGGG
jgi:AcrR family transcriptional regulator